MVKTNTFVDFPQENSADSFLVFTSLRCCICQELEPVPGQLVELVKGNEKALLLGNYNVNEKEPQPEFEVQRVPALYFKKAGEEKYKPRDLYCQLIHS